MQVIWICRTLVVIELRNYSCAYETLTADLSMPLLFSKLVVMFLGVRPLTEDEHLYLRLCKLGKFISFFKLS